MIKFYKKKKKNSLIRKTQMGSSGFQYRQGFLDLKHTYEPAFPCCCFSAPAAVTAHQHVNCTPTRSEHSLLGPLSAEGLPPLCAGPLVTLHWEGRRLSLAGSGQQSLGFYCGM